MNERIRKLAEQAGFRSDVTMSDGTGNHVVTKTEHALSVFAELIASEEREACAKICDRFIGTTKVIQAERIQSAIRARGEK